MRKKYNTPHRRHVVKTRMTDEEYADFTGRLAAYEISQSEFIRQAIRKATIRPIRQAWAMIRPSSALTLRSGDSRTITRGGRILATGTVP